MIFDFMRKFEAPILSAMTDVSLVKNFENKRVKIIRDDGSELEGVIKDFLCINNGYIKYHNICNMVFDDGLDCPIDLIKSICVVE